MYAKKVNKWAILIPVAVVLILAAAAVFFLTQYTMVGSQVYPKKLETLDLRGQEISIQEYEEMSRKLPQCHIEWDVPFQGKRVPSDSSSLTVTSLSADDVAAMGFFPALKTVDAMECRDYDQLAALMQQRPELAVSYQFVIGEQILPPDTAELRLGGISDQELQWLEYMKDLRLVTATGGGSGENFIKLEEYCYQRKIEFQVVIGGKVTPSEEKAVTVEKATSGDLALLSLFTELETLHLIDPQVEPEQLIGLKEAYPNAAITWEVAVFGKTLTNDQTKLDFSDVTVTGVEELEKTLKYLPELEHVFLGLQQLDNETVADFRQRNRQNYKVVWEVQMGKHKTLRTDITFFYPGRDWSKDGVAFGDSVAANLRYCEDLICVDAGHMGAVKHVEWLEGLVNLEYLILAHTDVRSLEGIQNCKKLKFLELDHTGIRDLTPLKECTALEDLNIGRSFPNVDPLLEMPWLKNIYMIHGSSAGYYKLSQGMPETNVVYVGSLTVSSGWRELPNYYFMRDALGAPYMDDYSRILKDQTNPYAS